MASDNPASRTVFPGLVNGVGVKANFVCRTCALLREIPQPLVTPMFRYAVEIDWNTLRHDRDKICVRTKSK